MTRRLLSLMCIVIRKLNCWQKPQKCLNNHTQCHLQTVNVTDVIPQLLRAALIFTMLINIL